jgi:hypothetical protein
VPQKTKQSKSEEEGKLTEMFKEFAATPELVEALNEHFAAMDGFQTATEFSRCVVFFLLGRIYEKKLQEGSGT